MSVFTKTLRFRMVVMLLAIIAALALALIVLMELLAPTFFSNQLNMMGMNEMINNGGMMGPMMGGTSTADLEAAFDSSFRRALILSIAAAGIAAVALGAFATRRILTPLDSIRAASRRMAQGSYTERVEVPDETELAAVAEDVNALAGALEATENRRARLVSEVAHELRTPLTTIEGYLEGILDGIFEPTDAVLAASSREIRRLKRLADDLGRLSRADADAPLALEPIDISTLAAAVGDQLRPQAGAKQITLALHAMGPVSIQGDRDGLTQVLTNIIGNAIAYTPDGGTVTITTEATTGQAAITVQDTGIGLTPTELSAAFDRFYRANPDAPGGTGIGLAIARSITKRHNGTITAQSPGPGQGATFIIRLPLA